MAEGDHHVLHGDQILQGEVAGAVHDAGAAAIGEAVADLQHLVFDELQQQPLVVEDGGQALDLRPDLGQLGLDLVPLQAGEALQPHVEDGLGLPLAEAEGGHQAVAGRLAVGAGPDDLDHLVDVIEGDLEALQDVGPGLGLAQLVAAAPGGDVPAVVDEVDQGLFEAEHPRLTVHDGQHVDAEARLQGGELEQLVQHDLGLGVALELDHHAHALAIALVAQIADADQALVPDQLGHLLQELGLVDLVGQLGDHDALAITGHGLDVGGGPDADDAPARGVGLADPAPPLDGAPGGEVRPGDDLHQLVEADLGVVHHRDGGVHGLTQVVRGDVGGHTDGDAGAAVDEQVGDLGRQDQGLHQAVVVVGPVIDGLFLDVGQELVGDLGHADLGVPHGRRRIPVDAAEVALAVDQGHPHGEVLGHTDQGVVDGLITVGVILTDAVTDDACRLLVRAVPVVLQVVHRVEHAPVHRLEPVTDVGEGPADDDRHGVIQVGHAHLVFDVDRDEALNCVVHWGSRLSLRPHRGRCK